ncbi:hypothetical protein [Solidesulfovibrio sp.]
MPETDTDDATNQVSDSLGDGIQSKFSGLLKEYFANELKKKKIDSTVASELIEFVDDLSLGYDDLKSVFVKGDKNGVSHD